MATPPFPFMVCIVFFSGMSLHACMDVCVIVVIQAPNQPEVGSSYFSSAPTNYLLGSSALSHSTPSNSNNSNSNNNNNNSNTNNTFSVDELDDVDDSVLSTFPSFSPRPSTTHSSSLPSSSGSSSSQFRHRVAIGRLSHEPHPTSPSTSSSSQLMRPSTLSPVPSSVPAITPSPFAPVHSSSPSQPSSSSSLSHYLGLRGSSRLPSLSSSARSSPASFTHPLPSPSASSSSPTPTTTGLLSTSTANSSNSNNSSNGALFTMGSTPFRFVLRRRER